VNKSPAKVAQVFATYKDVILWIVFGILFAVVPQIATHFNSGSADGYLNPIHKALTYATAYPLVGILKLFGLEVTLETTFMNTINSMLSLVQSTHQHTGLKSYMNAPAFMPGSSILLQCLHTRPQSKTDF
jgi:hypothetical protein